MTNYQARTLSTLFETFGKDVFTLFDAGNAMETTAGNILMTVNKLVKSGDLIQTETKDYKVKQPRIVLSSKMCGQL